MLGAALLAALAVPATGADLFAGYSGRRVDDAWRHGGALALATSRRGGALRFGLEATAHSSGASGQGIGDYGLMGGAALAPWPHARLSPFAALQAGMVGTREQVTIFGVPIGPEGVCDGGCPFTYGPAVEAGGGLDVRLGGRWAIRLGAGYRWHHVSGETTGGLRVFGGLARR